MAVSINALSVALKLSTSFQAIAPAPPAVEEQRGLFDLEESDPEDEPGGALVPYSQMAPTEDWHEEVPDEILLSQVQVMEQNQQIAMPNMPSFFQNCKIANVHLHIHQK